MSLGLVAEPSLALARQPSSEPTPAELPPDATSDDSEHSFFGGANGPGAGKLQVLAGGGGLVVTGGRDPVGGPGISLGMNYGIAEAADFRFRADTSAVFSNGNAAAAGYVDPSILVRVTGKRSTAANLGVMLGPEILWAAAGGGGIAAFGVDPGLALSFGSSSFQASLDLEFPIYFAVAGSLSGTGTAATIRPGLTLEGAVAKSTNLYARVSPQLSLSGGSGAIVSFVTGVTF